MSRKIKKAQVQDNSTIAGEENQMESIPTTIVEAGEAEIFTAQVDVENVENSKPEVVAEEQDGQPVEQATQLEQPAPKKPRADKRPFIPWLTEKLENPQDRKLLLKTILEKWPTVSKGGAQTFLTDMLNARYTYYKDRPVVKLADGKVCFADKAPVVAAEEVQEERTIDGTPAEKALTDEIITPSEEVSEQPAE